MSSGEFYGYNFLFTIHTINSNPTFIRAGIWATCANTVNYLRVDNLKIQAYAVHHSGRWKVQHHGTCVFILYYIRQGIILFQHHQILSILNSSES